MMELIRVDMKTRRQNVAGSLKKMMPTSTVPTAPIPVHIAYAVPSGKVRVALIRRTMLMIRQNAKLPYQSKDSVPVVAFALFRLAVNPTSNRPAIIRIIQFICA